MATSKDIEFLQQEKKSLDQQVQKRKTEIEEIINSLDEMTAKVEAKMEASNILVETQISSTTINDLSDEILMKIFNYLSISDRLKAQKVSARWFKLIWKHVNLADISEPVLKDIIMSIPRNVIHHFECHAKSLINCPTTFPVLMIKLQQLCPSLETLILETVVFQKNFCGQPSSKKPAFEDNPELSEVLKMSVHQIIESNFGNNHTLGLQDAVFPELQNLSLRQVTFNSFYYDCYFTSSFLPKITVLDLSHSNFMRTKFEDDLFSTLHNLEELYLAKWNLKDSSLLSFLSNVRKLRILDLENTLVSDNTIKMLTQNCAWLEELYLCFTEITDEADIWKPAKVKEFFPHLHSLCVRETDIEQESIGKLMATCPSLKSVTVSHSDLITKPWYNGLNKDVKEKVHFMSRKKGCCEHCSKRKYCRYLPR